MTRTTIMLSPKLKARVLRFARQHGISMGELIRESLEQTLRQETDAPVDPFIADTFTARGTGPTDIAANHDKYLALITDEKLNRSMRRTKRGGANGGRERS